MFKKPLFTSRNGMTLVGLMIAALVTSLLAIGLIRVWVHSNQSFAKEKELLELQQSATEAMRRLTDLFIQAGADLPKDENVISLLDQENTDICLYVNNKAAFHQFEGDFTSSNCFKVDNANGFFGQTSIWKRINSNQPSFEARSIAISNNDGDFIDGIDTLHDSICLENAEEMKWGDQIYCFTQYRIRYVPDSSKIKLTIGDIQYTLAENVADFQVLFFDNSKQAQNSWPDMVLCSLYIELHAPERRLWKTQEHYYRIKLGKLIPMRNRVM